MRLRTVLSFSLGALLAVAQDNPMQVILVGSTQDSPGGIFQFIPPSINATNGTTITFRFTGAPGNHTVTQSSFTDPCDPLPGGFDSGWVFIPPNNVSTSPEWNLTITNSSRPLWFFCKQLLPLTHCSAGMVGAINAPSSGNLTFSAYQTNAQAFKGNSGQGQGSLVGQGASASAAPGPIVSGAQVFTGVPIASDTAPSSPSNTAPVGGGTSGGGSGSGALGLKVDLFLTFLGVGLGAFIGLA